jgi:hypothetical protein
MKTTHSALTLCGDRVENGISVSNGQVPFNPRWGMTRHNTGLLASTPAPDGSLDKVHVAIVDEGVVLVPCEGTPQKELVLVQQYSPGSGGKRWPGFYVEFGPEVRRLSSASTSGGSGGETWVLLSAPLGWAENIAGQFVNERDYGGQTIVYRPDFNPREKELKQELERAREGLRCLQERLDFIVQTFEEVRKGQGEYNLLSFRQGTHPKTGETQWEATVRSGGLTVKYLADRWSRQPDSAEEWICQENKVLVDKSNFRLVVVDLVFRPQDRKALEVEIEASKAEIQKIEAELAQIRKPAADNPGHSNSAMAEALRKAGLV